MARFRTVSLGIAAAIAATLLLGAPSAWAADPVKVEKAPDVKVETPPADDLDPTRDSTILSRSAAKRRGENPDDSAGAGDGEIPAHLDPLLGRRLRAVRLDQRHPE